MPMNAFLLALNTGSPEPSGSAPKLNSGVILPEVAPELMLFSHWLIFELVTCSLFEFGQSPKATTEESRGGQVLPGFKEMPSTCLAPSDEARDEFVLLTSTISEFCSAFDTLSFKISKNMFAIMSSETFSTRARSLDNSSTSLVNRFVA